MFHLHDIGKKRQVFPEITVPGYTETLTQHSAGTWPVQIGTEVLRVTETISSYRDAIPVHLITNSVKTHLSWLVCYKMLVYCTAAHWCSSNDPCRMRTHLNTTSLWPNITTGHLYGELVWGSTDWTQELLCHFSTNKTRIEKPFQSTSSVYTRTEQCPCICKQHIIFFKTKAQRKVICQQQLHTFVHTVPKFYNSTAIQSSRLLRQYHIFWSVHDQYFISARWNKNQ